MYIYKYISICIIYIHVCISIGHGRFGIGYRLTLEVQSASRERLGAFAKERSFSISLAAGRNSCSFRAKRVVESGICEE